MKVERTRHGVRCPQCGRYVPADANGYYDREDRADELSFVACFCSEDHADKYHAVAMLGRKIDVKA